VATRAGIARGNELVTIADGLLQGLADATNTYCTDCLNATGELIDSQCCMERCFTEA